MYSVLNTLSEYTYFYITKDITSYTFSLVFKIVKSYHCCIFKHFIFSILDIFCTYVLWMTVMITLL